MTSNTNDNSRKNLTIKIPDSAPAVKSEPEEKHSTLTIDVSKMPKVPEMKPEEKDIPERGNLVIQMPVVTIKKKDLGKESEEPEPAEEKPQETQDTSTQEDTVQDDYNPVEDESEDSNEPSDANEDEQISANFDTDFLIPTPSDDIDNVDDEKEIENELSSSEDDNPSEDLVDESDADETVLDFSDVAIDANTKEDESENQQEIDNIAGEELVGEEFADLVNDISELDELEESDDEEELDDDLLDIEDDIDETSDDSDELNEQDTTPDLSQIEALSFDVPKPDDDVPDNDKEVVCKPEPDGKLHSMVSALVIFLAMFISTLIIVPMFSVAVERNYYCFMPDSMILLGNMDNLGEKLLSNDTSIESSDNSIYPFSAEALRIRKKSEIIAASEKNNAALNMEQVDEQAQEQVDAATQDKMDKDTETLLANRRKPAITESFDEIEEIVAEPVPSAQNQHSAEVPRDGDHYSAISISGEIIPIIISRTFVPDTGAGVWQGDNVVDDGMGCYILGHNPGSFHNLMDENYDIGDQFIVWDAAGHCKVYTIDDVFYVPHQTYFTADFRNRTIDSGGECVTLQTCVNDQQQQYKIMVAH